MKKNMPRTRATIQGKGNVIMKHDDVCWLECFTMSRVGQADLARLLASILVGSIIAWGMK